MFQLTKEREKELREYAAQLFLVEPMSRVVSAYIAGYAAAIHDRNKTYYDELIRKLNDRPGR